MSSVTKRTQYLVVSSQLDPYTYSFERRNVDQTQTGSANDAVMSVLYLYSDFVRPIGISLWGYLQVQEHIWAKVKNGQESVQTFIRPPVIASFLQRTIAEMEFNLKTQSNSSTQSSLTRDQSQLPQLAESQSENGQWGTIYHDLYLCKETMVPSRSSSIVLGGRFAVPSCSVKTAKKQRDCWEDMAGTCEPIVRNDLTDLTQTIKST